MNEIGGYFELELRKGNEYHNDAIRLNTGRNALELILISKNFRKVYIPYYTCDVILEPLKKHHIEFEFYHITIELEPIFNYSIIKEHEGFIYINYFGLKDDFIEKIASFCKNLIIDNTQSFFSKPISKIPTFYSCRKFFGVPDGSYLYLDEEPDFDFSIDHSENRFAHLLKRVEYDAKYGYNDFKENDISLIGQPILQMSKLTKALLCNIDYEYVEKIRRENFLVLQQYLSEFNNIRIKLNKSIPMVYPLLLKKKDTKKKFIQNGIYVPTYWPNVLKWCKRNHLEYMLADQMIFLPIDQRYSKLEMEQIVTLIQK